MNLSDLPPAPALRAFPPAQQLVMFVESITREARAYAVLAGDLEALDCSLVAKRAGPAVRASIARSKDQLDEATRLVHKRYAWRGYLTASDDLSLEHDGICSVTLVAGSEDATVGTMTLGLDGPRGLLVAREYAERVAAVRAEGRRACELSWLALAEEADTKTVLSTLFSLAYGVAKAQDVTDVFIEVNPRHVAFYRRVLGFVVDAGERLCERVQAPAVLLRTSMEDLEARLRRYCNPAPSEGKSCGSLQMALA